jgi:hypothetical protein
LAGSFPPVGPSLRSALHKVYLEMQDKPSNNPTTLLLPNTQEDLDKIDFYGEVVDLLLDGRALIRFPSGKEESFPLDRLYRLDDGMDGDESEDGDGEDDMMILDQEQEIWMSDDESGMIGSDGEVDSGEMAEAGEGIEMQWDLNMDGEEDVRGWDEEDEELADEVAGNIGIDVHEIVLPSVAKEEPLPPVEEEDSPLWQRYVLLDEAPKVVPCAILSSKYVANLVILNRIITISTKRSLRHLEVSCRAFQRRSKS